MKNSKPIPGPKNKWGIDLYFRFIKAPFIFFLETAKAFPGISKFRFFHQNIFLLSAPTYIKHILQTHNRNYIKGKDQNQIKKLGGSGLFTAEGDYWRKRRKQLQPHFYKKTIEGYLDIMLWETEAVINELKKKQDQTIDLNRVLSKLSLQIISRCLFNYRVEEDFDEAITEILSWTYDRMTGAVPPAWLPTARNKQFQKHWKRLQTVVDQIWGQPVEDDQLFLSTLKDGSFTPQQAKDEIITMFIAGHETTAIALAFTIYLLAKHPEKEAQLRQEAQKVLGDRRPRVADTRQLIYTRQVIQESMRLFPPAWGTSRTPLTDDRIGGFSVKKGSIVNISPYAMHRLPRYWPRPEAFQPERFEAAPEKFTYIPFGSGPRKCIGEHFAMMEMTVVLALMYQKLQFELVNQEPIEVVSKITLKPKENILVRVV